MRDVRHEVELAVVGGGLAGLCAALAAARHGTRVLLMHDRPVLGGNASSEVRMWICGAHGPNRRETGIVEELHLSNLYLNPSRSYAMWDAVLHELARREPNLTLLLNCTCTAATMRGAAIESIRGWQLTSETWHTVHAALFCDSSGDSILAPLTGAEVRVGREAAGEFGEDIEPDEADARTMGMSCLLQCREMEAPQPFRAPSWARKFESCDCFPHRSHQIGGTNFWWIELGGEQDTIHDTEAIRDALLPITYGVWDHIKNHCPKQDATNWSLEWVGYLPGKRESRRYVGDHMLTQNDVRAEGRFEDLVAYGGWSMDDHHPGGFAYPGRPTIFHPAPSPFGIPYRCLYSRNVANLFCAGRNISATHAAMSSSRVMATSAVVGQAVGTAAAIAARDGLTPRAVGERIAELRQALMDDDCWLPWRAREIPELSREASLTATAGDPEPLRNGVDRPWDEADNSWTAAPGESVTYTLAVAAPVREARLVFDSDLNRKPKNMPCSWARSDPPFAPPATLARAFEVAVARADGRWEATRVADNYQRLVRVPLAGAARAVRLTPHATWGAESVRVFAFDVR